MEDTYCEAFDGLLARILVTAKTEKLLLRAVNSATALPSTVFNEAEGGIEKLLKPSETPDGRLGAIIQLWVNHTKKAHETLEHELAKRIRQGILVVPTTRIFNALSSKNKDPKLQAEDYIDTMAKVGHCGDGYERVIRAFGREMISIPLMMGDFLIERMLGVRSGVMGGNVWFFCESESAALEAGDRAVDALRDVGGVITPFDICSAGSKVETNFPEIGPTTNHPFCPTCRSEIPDSKVPDGIKSIPEIVIDGLDLESVKEGMKVAIYAGAEVDGVARISAGNYGGKLGRYHIRLRELI